MKTLSNGLARMKAAKLFQTQWAELWVLLTANAMSLIGNSLSAIAIPWFVYEITGSALTTAGVVLAGQLPNIVIGFFSGPLIDRFSAKQVSVFCDAVNAIAIVLIPVLFSIGILDTVSISRSKFGVFGDFQSRLQGFWSHLFRFRLQKTGWFILAG
ncbi:MFS transporter [Chloroflexi bacterium TSY]|nr:MFS transporter [Chloroflexi bacterium TSY]